LFPSLNTIPSSLLPQDKLNSRYNANELFFDSFPKVFYLSIPLHIPFNIFVIFLKFHSCCFVCTILYTVRFYFQILGTVLMSFVKEFRLSVPLHIPFNIFLIFLKFHSCCFVCTILYTVRFYFHSPTSHTHFPRLSFVTLLYRIFYIQTHNPITSILQSVSCTSLFSLPSSI
jgi:hypothetical protein